MENQHIISRLDRIEKTLKFIQENMFDPDAVMTLEEEKRFERAMREYEQGKTTSLEDLKKELET